MVCPHGQRAPLGLWVWGTDSVPRAVPWAGTGRPVGPQNTGPAQAQVSARCRSLVATLKRSPVMASTAKRHSAKGVRPRKTSTRWLVLGLLLAVALIAASGWF